MTDTLYDVVRHRQDGADVVVAEGLDLDEAQAWCRRDDTHGPGWFDGYRQALGTDEVLALDFRRSKPQVWHDPWRDADRTCRFKGRCLVCLRRCYAFDDGENDPRGALGDRAAYEWTPVEDAGLVHPDSKRDEAADAVVACAICANDYDAYQAGMATAGRLWRRQGWRLP